MMITIILNLSESLKDKNFSHFCIIQTAPDEVNYI